MKAFPILATLLAFPLQVGGACAADLPDAVRTAGAFRLSVNSTCAPMEFHDPATNELKGLDVDLAAALAKRLGVGILDAYGGERPPQVFPAARSAVMGQWLPASGRATG